MMINPFLILEKIIFIKFYNNFIIMKILITGGSGYLGGRLAEYFLKTGNEVTIATRNDINQPLLNNAIIKKLIGMIMSQYQMLVLGMI